MADDSCAKLSERLNIIFIDLVSIRHAAKNKSADKLTPIEKWGLFFSYVDHDDKQDFINSIIQSEHGIMAAQNIVKHMSKEDDNWFYQFSVWKAECDYNTRMSNATKRGREEGLKEGLQQGIQQGAQQNAEKTARRMLQGKLTPDETALYTGLSLEKVLELQKEI